MLAAFLLSTNEDSLLQQSTSTSTSNQQPKREPFSLSSFQNAFESPIPLLDGLLSAELNLGPLFDIVDDGGSIVVPRYCSAEDMAEEQEDRDVDDHAEGEEKMKRWVGPRIRVSQATPSNATRTFHAVVAAMLEACFLRDVRLSSNGEEPTYALRTADPSRRRRYMIQQMFKRLLDITPSAATVTTSSISNELKRLFQPTPRNSGQLKHTDPLAPFSMTTEEHHKWVLDAFTDRFEDPLPEEEGTQFYHEELQAVFQHGCSSSTSRKGDTDGSLVSWVLLEPILPLTLLSPLREVMADQTMAGWFTVTGSSKVAGAVERLRWQLLDAFTCGSHNVHNATDCSTPSSRLAATLVRNIVKKMERRNMQIPMEVRASLRGAADSMAGIAHQQKEEEAKYVANIVEEGISRDWDSINPSVRQFLGLNDDQGKQTLERHVEILCNDSSKDRDLFWMVLVYWTLVTNEVEQIQMRN